MVDDIKNNCVEKNNLLLLLNYAKNRTFVGKWYPLGFSKNNHPPPSTLSDMHTRTLHLILLFFILLTSRAAAQQAHITGHVIDKESREAMEKATVQLYHITTTQGRRDTTFATGSYTDESGHFAISPTTTGIHLLRITSLGYKSEERTFNLAKNQSHALGDIVMTVDAIVLAEATVTANIPKMVVKDDTLVYNADAYRVPEGSVIESLIEMLPGAKVDDNGSVTINGKNVRRFKMDGRDFMTGNNDAVMKNLPSYVIDQVKAYDEKSDLSKLTGIDDGNEDFVLEFVTKRSMRNGLQMNPDIGIGTKHRYGIRLTAMKPFGDVRYTFMGNANNVNDRNFSGRGGRGRGNGNGQRHTKTGALDVSYEDGKGLRMSGRVTWSHSNTDNWSRTGSESFVNTRGGAFSNSISQNYSRANSWTGNINLQWRIDSITNLSFRPNFSYSTNDGRGFSNSASFNANPYDHIEDPNDTAQLATMHKLGLIVNSRNNKTMSYSSGKNASTQAQLFRRLNNKGRSIAISGSINYRDNDNTNANLTAVHLYQVANRQGNDSTYQTNRYTASPSDNFSYSIGATYTEPLYIFKTPEPETPVETAPAGPPVAVGDGVAPAMMGPASFGQGGMQRGGPGGGRGGGRGNQRRNFGTQGIFLQLNYRYNYSYQKNDPSTYDFPDLSNEAFYDVLNKYREWTRLFGYLESPYESYLSDSLSRYSERTEYGHNADVQLRLVREKLNLNLGVSTQPERTHYIQQYLGRPIDTVRTVVNVTPTLNMRYRFNQQTNLQVTLRGSTSQPSITQLLDIYDDTNPLNITMGNPGLKPSLTSNLNTNFMMQRQPTYVEDSLGMLIPKAQRHWSFSTNASLQRTFNSIGNIVTYNEDTGGRITRPDNINGNWGVNGGMTFNLALDTLNRWDVSGSIRGSYDHRVSYVNLKRTAIPDRNITHTYNFSPSASLSFRNSWLSVSLNANTTYAHTENRLQASNNLTTWNFSYGANSRINFDWGMAISTDLHVFSKRGYDDKTLNTDEFIWNAQISQSFLRGKKLTVMLQLYDILQQQTTFSRTVNANGWTDREVNAITSYAMLHVSYRLNMFGGGGNRGGRGGFGRGEGPRGGWGGGRPGGGFPGGGFPGGGRPGGGF